MDVGDEESPALGEVEPRLSGVKPLVEGESVSIEWPDHALAVELPVELPFLVGTSRSLSRSLPFPALASSPCDCVSGARRDSASFSRSLSRPLRGLRESMSCTNVEISSSSVVVLKNDVTLWAQGQHERTLIK